MHPSELKNQALVAAAMAEREGFTATADALKLLATACAAEARELLHALSAPGTRAAVKSTSDRGHPFEVVH